jgi:predicted acylesterase/phospholipase RssA
VATARRKRILIPKKSKVAFVCSGGAAKAGAYHIGVALALREKGFHFVGGLKNDDDGDKESAHLKAVDNSGREISVYVGSSAGSILCSFLAAGYSLDAIFDSFLRSKRSINLGEKPLPPLNYKKLFSLKKEAGVLSPLYEFIGDNVDHPRLSGLVSGLVRESFKSFFMMGWTKTPGIFTTAGIEKYLREEVLPSNDFKRYKADLFLVATQLNHSRKVVFGKYSNVVSVEDKSCVYFDDTTVSQAAAASTSLPPIFCPYPISKNSGNKVYYFDGEIRDTLSTHIAVDAGADLVIASYTHQPYHFKRDIGSLHHYGIPMILIQTIYLIIERKIEQYRQFYDRSRATYEALEQALSEVKIPENKKNNILEMFTTKMNFKPNVDYIHIHPRPHDHEMFFGDHFNLNPKVLKEVVRIGFRNAIDVLRRYDFE